MLFTKLDAQESRVHRLPRHEFLQTCNTACKIIRQTKSRVSFCKTLNDTPTHASIMRYCAVSAWYSGAHTPWRQHQYFKENTLPVNSGNNTVCTNAAAIPPACTVLWRCHNQPIVRHQLSSFFYRTHVSFRYFMMFQWLLILFNSKT